MKRCIRCNKLLHDTATICPTCGAACDSTDKETATVSRSQEKSPAVQAKAGNSPASKKRKHKKKSKRVSLLLLVAALILVIAIVFVAVRNCKHGGGSTNAFSDTQIGVPAPESGSARIETPALTGLPIAEATTKLTGVGLVADVQETGYDPAYADGVVTAQSVAVGEWLTKGDHITLTVNSLPLTLSVLQTSVRSGRITLGNVPEICRTMDTNNPNFDFSIIIHAVEDYEIKGGFRCLVGPDEETPISRVNTQFLREGQLVNGLESAVAYRDAIVWTFALEDWTGFHFENVTDYDVYLSNRVDTTSAVKKTFLPEATRSMALVDCPAASGRIRIDIPTADALTIRITDPALPDGYTNSPNAGGSLAPKWTVKLVIGSYQWISVTVDGTGGEAQSAMQASGLKFMQKGAKASPFDGASYTAEGDVMVVSVPLPADIDFDPYAVSYMELDFGDGAYTEKIKIQ